MTGAFGGRRFDFHYGTDEAVAAAHDGLHKARLFRVVAEGLADFADGGVDAVLGIDEDFVAPKAFGDFGARDEVAFAGGEEDEQLHWLAFELEASTRTP